MWQCGQHFFKKELAGPICHILSTLSLSLPPLTSLYLSSIPGGCESPHSCVGGGRGGAAPASRWRRGGLGGAACWCRSRRGCGDCDSPRAHAGRGRAGALCRRICRCVMEVYLELGTMMASASWQEETGGGCRCAALLGREGRLPRRCRDGPRRHLHLR